MIAVLRLSHRVGRDDRTTTHVGLTARALGAEKIILSGDRDEGVEKSLSSVAARWGGVFSVSYEKDWKRAIKSFHGTKVHLTMYGLPVQSKMAKIRKSRNVLVIVGGEKVPAEVYGLADYNIAVTSQPHSEVAALAIFLRELLGKKSLEKKFPKAKIKIVPQERGKKTVLSK